MELTSRRDNLGKVKIIQGIFQGDRLSPLLFITFLIPHSHPVSYEYGKSESSVNHLLYMDNLKLFSKSEK